MTRTSPSAERAIRIVEFLAEHPERSFGLADLTRRLGLSHATAHALLATLVGEGWVRRSSDRTFSIGPALVAVGVAARRGLRVVDEALPHMEALAADLGVECQAGVVAGSDVVVVSRVGRRTPFSEGVEVGARAPLSPPIGAPYVAWSTPAEIDAYLDRSPTPMEPAQRERLRRVLAVVRERGYAVTLDQAIMRRLRDVIEGRAVEGPEGDLGGEMAGLLTALAHEEYATGDLEADAHHDITSVSAPVFGPDGTVVLVIGIGGFGHRIVGGEVPPPASPTAGDHGRGHRDHPRATAGTGAAAG